MVIAWFVYIISLLIFMAFGWTGMFHAKKYKVPGDLTDFATSLYVFAMISLVILTVFLVLISGGR